MRDIIINTNQPVVPVLAAAPTGVPVGYQYYDSVDEKVYVWDGATWKGVGGDSGGTTVAANLVYAGPVSGVNTSPSFRALEAADLPTVSGPQTIVRGGSFGTEQAAVTIPQAAAGEPRCTLGYVIMSRPDDGKTYTLTRFAVRLGSDEGPNMTISADFTFGIKRVTYGSGNSVVSTIAYTTSDGGRGQAAKTTAPNATIGVGEDMYVYAVAGFGGAVLSAGPISWEAIFTIT